MLKLITRHTNCVKPALKEKNKKDRMKFCLSMLDEATTTTARPKFKTMHNVVHIDEKWFNMTKKNKTYYLLDGEEEPTRPIHGSCIGKVMFLTAVARPRWDSEGNVTFSGKIGIWPFVKEVPAHRKSENRPRGTIETKSIEK
uniref:Transposase n=1 Tax=Hordeum vulgare subsp. vulgare TaxID=112509 RepID=A0A8I6Y6P5_HORVV